MIVAHIFGLPIEESVLQLAPAAGILAVLGGARLRGLAGLLRRRKPDNQTR